MPSSEILPEKPWAVWVDIRNREDDYDLEHFEFDSSEEALKEFQLHYNEPGLYRLDLNHNRETVVTYRPRMMS